MKLFTLLIVVALVVGLTSCVYAVEVRRTGKIVDMEGSVEVRKADGELVPADIGMMLTEGDIVKTKANSWAFLNLDGVETATVEMEENSQLLLSELTMDEEKGTQQTLLDLALGKILVTAQKLHHDDSNFNVKTPTSVVGVRGTTFAVEVEGVEE